MAKKSTPVLSRANLWSLEEYAKRRPTFRPEVIAHKKNRTVHLGNHLALQFEDEMTVRYQIQEMLRVEAEDEGDANERDGVQGELDAYLPLIPDGSNLKATMLFEFPDPEVRMQRLSLLGGIEHRVFAEVDGGSRLFAHADEDMERSAEEKTSAVHFLRFEFPAGDLDALRNGAELSFGIDDPRLPERAKVSAATRTALLSDFTG